MFMETPCVKLPLNFYCFGLQEFWEKGLITCDMYLKRKQQRGRTRGHILALNFARIFTRVILRASKTVQFESARGAKLRTHAPADYLTVRLR